METRVCARLEISGSNPSLCKVHILLKYCISVSACDGCLLAVFISTLLLRVDNCLTYVTGPRKLIDRILHFFSGMREERVERARICLIRILVFLLFFDLLQIDL